MPFIVWTSQLSVDVKILDNDHKRLVILINDLHDALMAGRDSKALEGIFDELVANARIHFAHEEKLLAAAGYGDVAAHKQEHEQKILQLLSMQSRFKSARESAAYLEVLDQLKNWLLEHTESTDKEFVEHLKTRPKPKSLAVTSGIPATFSWEAVPGAKSYNFYLAKAGASGKITILANPALLLDPKYSLGYPDIDQAQTYTWKIQTCAHADGTVCGAWSQEKTLATQALATVTTPGPADGATIYADQLSQKISWNKNPGASAYHYIITLTTSNEAQACTQDKIEKTTTMTSDLVDLNCLGIYQFTVQPCVDSACASVGPTSTWKFTLSQKIPASKSAFAICGASYDNPDTPWNEREACQPKHLLLLIKIALDFLLFQLSLLLLPIMALITGLIFYSQFKTPDTWEKVISAWKAIGIGYGLLIFAWIIVGILLQIAGYSGLWFKIL